MLNIRYTTDINGYVDNFVIFGDLPGSASIDVSDFNTQHFDCYKLVGTNLVWDEEKYQAKVNPAPTEPQPSELDILKEQVATQQSIIDELLFEVIPSLLLTDE